MSVERKKGRSKKKLSKNAQKLISNIEKFQSILKSEGLRVPSGPSDYARDLFGRLSPGLQRSLVKSFEHYMECVAQLKRSGLSVRDTRRLTWAYLKLQGLAPCSDTFLNIDEGTLVEVFNRDYIQIFRNIRFFEEFDVPIFDLLVNDWMTNFKRDPEVEERLFLRIESCFRKLPRVGYLDDLESHKLQRRFADSSKARQIQYGFYSPLIGRFRRTRKVEAVLVTSRLLDSQEGSAPIQLVG